MMRVVKQFQQSDCLNGSLQGWFAKYVSINKMISDKLPPPIDICSNFGGASVMITMSLNSIFHVIGLQPWRVNRIINKNMIEESFTLIMTGVVRFSMHI